MTELEQLKALLDQRGEPYVMNDFGVTWRYASDPHTATESMDGTLIVTGMTARQAIDATIGREECHTVAMDCFGNPPYNQSGLNGNSTACGCSECGAPWSTTGLFRGNQMRHNFKACPICGRRIVGDAE